MKKYYDYIITNCSNTLDATAWSRESELLD